MSLHRRLAASTGSLLALTLALSGCTSSGDDAEEAASSSAALTPAEPEAQPIEWTDCSADIDTIIAGRPGY